VDVESITFDIDFEPFLAAASMAVKDGADEDEEMDTDSEPILTRDGEVDIVTVDCCC